jgi:hypothetical protein
MNKLSPEHLHLLLDEPIFVLEEHFEGHIQESEPKPDGQPTPVAEVMETPEYNRANKKGILIVTNSSDTEAVADEEFLFKGLNALDIHLSDIAIIKNPADSNTIEHSIRIDFNAETKADLSYKVEIKEGISYLQCHPLEQIRNRQDLKVKLWLGLKSLFIN